LFGIAHLERTLFTAKEEVGKHTEDTLDKQKDLASEKAMAKMDKYSRQEVLDNDWLKQEVQSIYWLGFHWKNYMYSVCFYK